MADCTKGRVRWLFVCWLGMSACACIPSSERLLGADLDLRPPQILGAEARSQRSFAILFDEAVIADPGDIRLSGGAVVEGLESVEGGLVIRLAADQEPGALYAIEGHARDERGNEARFLLRVSGFNPRPAQLRISEVLTEKGKSHRDFVELVAMACGNLAGLELEVRGTSSAYRYLFPAKEISEGEVLVLHLLPEGLGAELDETGTDMAGSGGLDALPGAWDLWYRGDEGQLPGSNGMVTLRASPGGPILDALYYGDRDSGSDARYGGFGSEAMRQAAAGLKTAGAWFRDAELRPEEAASSRGSTATRSICRSSSLADSDGPGDWHVVPSGKASPGLPNCDDTYVKK